jgi:hypothetical protein
MTNENIKNVDLKYGKRSAWTLLDDQWVKLTSKGGWQSYGYGLVYLSNK